MTELGRKDEPTLSDGEVVTWRVEDEDKILKQAAAIEQKRRNLYQVKADAIVAQAKAGEKFTDAQLVYAASTRCPCGEGMAYPVGCGAFHYWECSAVLTHRAPEAIHHSPRMYFTMWDIKSEMQPSAQGMTTRPSGEATA